MKWNICNQCHKILRHNGPLCSGCSTRGAQYPTKEEKMAKLKAERAEQQQFRENLVIEQVTEFENIKEKYFSQSYEDTPL